MNSDQYIWLLWSSAFLIPWALVYMAFPAQRRAMLWASLFTTPFGLSEPLFVPEYWMPPSLFDLAENTGFDIESLIFCFGIGGIGSVFYNLLSKKIPQTLASCERNHRVHRYHYMALATPFVVFIVLYFFPWNPIYPSIIAMFSGTLATMLCRPDLKRKTWIGGLLFLIYYAIFLAGLEWSAPGYIERIWNMEALSGITVWFMPIEELLFAIGFGMYWSGVYEHFTWRKLKPVNQNFR
ncbi:MAG: lycopene cyclase domain-containing protein [Gammaproteobacteria bacterium]|nr:lycopene cyclase domain-containing protein [Gammaproteobacteria bacterium]MCF6362714.1 lycopene cyclase domain-containing protein [Gammaproteobacteria bacterium]